MVDGFLLPSLALFTIIAGLVLALWSKRRTDRLNHQRTEDKSTLAKDGPGKQPFR